MAPIALNVAPLNAPQRELEWKPLADLDYQITEENLMSSKHHIHLLNELKIKYESGTDILGIWDSSLPIFKLPQVRQFPDLIHLCAICYDATQRAVLDPSGSAVFYVTPEAIREMLQFKTKKKLVPLSLIDLIKQGAKLTDAQVTKLNQLYISSDTMRYPPIHNVYLNQLGRDLADMISPILGYNSVEFVDETVILMMLMFSLDKTPICYDYATYISDKIHEQLMNLARERLFRYTSYIYHLILYYQHEKFSFPMRRMDAQGKVRLVVYWSPIFHSRPDTPYTYCEFIDLFIHPAMSMLMNSPPPRLTEEMQRILHLSKAYSIGDWYLYQNHTIIRIYGCELPPYRLPKYVPMRLFALEYFRQFGNADVLHFSGKGKKAQLKVRNELGHFIYNKRDEGWQEADRMLESLGLETSFLWTPYDPNHFISMRRVRYRLSSYNHLRIPHIEQYANLSEWQEGTLEEPITQEELALKGKRDLLKIADLELCTQVYSFPGTQVQAAASSSKTNQQTIQTAGQTSSKGKEKEMEEQQVHQQVQHEEVQQQQQQVQQQKEEQQGKKQPLQPEKASEAQVSTEQQTQSTVPPRPETTVEASVLQTPQKEDISRKRDRETPLTTSASQGEKRQRLNPLSEEEIPLGHSLGIGTPSREASASSFQQGQERTVGGEVSSSSQQRGAETGIKQQFIEIKRRNEPIRIQLYNHLLKMAPTNQ